jgi:hypothetical protein
MLISQPSYGERNRVLLFFVEIVSLVHESRPGNDNLYPPMMWESWWSREVIFLSSIDKICVLAHTVITTTVITVFLWWKEALPAATILAYN